MPLAHVGLDHRLSQGLDLRRASTAAQLLLQIRAAQQSQKERKLSTERANPSDTEIRMRRRIPLKDETSWVPWLEIGTDLKADEEIRTLDPLLGKEMLYH